MTVGFRMPLLDVQGIGSGVYLHIRQQLLSPTATSLTVGVFPTALSEDIFLSVTAFSKN
jgi:hypothetical protein